jgi:MFS family permease
LAFPLAFFIVQIAFFLEENPEILNNGLSMSAELTFSDIRTTRFSRILPWLVWGMSSLFVTYQMLLQTAPSVMITDFEQAFSINAFGVSLLASSFYYTYVLFQIPSGMLIDRVQPRYCLTACLILISIVTAVLASAHTLNMARTARILQGAFSSPSVIPAMYLAAIWFPARRFALLAGLTEMIGMSGSAIGQIMLAPACGYFGWRAALVGCAMAGLILAGLTWFIIRNKPADENCTLNSVPATAPHKTHIFRNLMIVISYPQAWINGLFAGLLFSVSGAFGAFWCIPYLIQTYSVSLNVAAAASSMTLFGTALGAPAIGWLSDRLGVRRLPMIMSTVVVLVLMLVLLYVPINNLPAMFFLLFFLGFFSSAYVLPYAVVRDFVPAHVRGTAMGYTNMMCILIGAPILQPLIGWILDNDMKHAVSSSLAYQHALLVLPISLGLGLLLAFFVRETYCGRKAAA